MRQKSVAIIGTRGYPSYYGGFETAVRKLAPYLADAGWQVTVYGRPGTAVSDGASADSRVESRVTRGIESKSLSTLSFGLTASVDAITRRKPSVALVMNVANGYYLPLFRARGIPTLVNVDGIEWDREKWGRVAKAMFRTGAALTARFGTELVFDAIAIGDRWRSEFGREGTFIPYGGTPSYSPTPPLGLEAGSYALMVARFVPENTVPEFLQAAQTLAEDHPVLLVGSSGYGGDIDAAAKRLSETHPNIRWLGHVSDDSLLFSLFQHAGAYFHGHSVGGTNPALVQAMACGAPVIARDTVYNREVLGDKGMFVAPDPESITTAVRTMLRDRHSQDRARANARQRSSEHYTWELVCSRYEQALSELVGKG